ncbi:MAG TPA: fumarylacetoacetate hydrolase family protein [Acetobacteraceae bacterium]|nr:fumarylacetoacetate hydrolase family protein [Acetobacteraceae bacterium]
MMNRLRAGEALPDDRDQAVLVGRAWRPDRGGPSIVTLRGGQVLDITSRKAPTSAALFALADPAGWAREAEGEAIGAIDELLANSDEAARDPARPWLLSPVDLQAVKASGVTFVVSLLERVIEEQARGAPEKAVQIRADLDRLIGTDLAALRPGSEEAMAVKEALIARGIWSQYLEVGIGPDAEIFTKSQPMSTVGTGAHIGIHPNSVWNNPEPEIVLVVSGDGRIAGATLGNDVNLRDFEGRSALLLGKAKDNNASCSLGPFVRLFDAGFTLDDVRQARLDLKVEGDDGFVLHGMSSMTEISRDPEELVHAAMGENHQYPDGFILMLGTMFAPVEDRGAPGEGFTHKLGDVVTISARRLGALQNRVMHCADCAPWDFGASALMRNLAARGLL